MRTFFGLLVALTFTMTFSGCENPQQKKITKEEKQEEKAVNEDAKGLVNDIDENAKEDKAAVKAARDDADAIISEEAKEDREEAKTDK